MRFSNSQGINCHDFLNGFIKCIFKLIKEYVLYSTVVPNIVPQGLYYAMSYVL